MLEAVESHWAEAFDVPGPVCRFEELPAAERPGSLADFAAHRARPPAGDEAYRWAEAEDLLTGGRLHLPFELVSMDFTRHVPSLFDRASNGVATGATREEALAASLHELIERDGVTEWQAQDIVTRTASQLLVETIPFDWFGHWRERLQAERVRIRCYHVASLTGTPLFLCELRDNGKDAAIYQSLSGRGCHPDPEIALFGAMTEAIQGRATYVAGAREDLMPFYRATPPGDCRTPYGLPLASGMRGVAWTEVAGGPPDPLVLGEALAAAGFGRIAVIDLAALDGLHVTRAFAYGLGSMTRRRRCVA